MSSGIDNKAGPKPGFCDFLRFLVRLHLFLVSWAEKRTAIRIWDPLKNSKGVSIGPVEVKFSSSNSPGMSYTCVVSEWGLHLFQKSNVVGSPPSLSEG